MSLNTPQAGSWLQCHTGLYKQDTVCDIDARAAILPLYGFCGGRSGALTGVQLLHSRLELHGASHAVSPISGMCASQMQASPQADVLCCSRC